MSAKQSLRKINKQSTENSNIQKNILTVKKYSSTVLSKKNNLHLKRCSILVCVSTSTTGKTFLQPSFRNQPHSTSPLLDVICMFEHSTHTVFGCWKKVEIIKLFQHALITASEILSHLNFSLFTYVSLFACSVTGRNHQCLKFNFHFINSCAVVGWR